MNSSAIPRANPALAPHVYDRLAVAYTRMHERFLWLAGGEASGTLKGVVAGAAEPGMKMLDAGCGTGSLARQLLALCPGLRLTLLDASPAMIACTGDIVARRVHGDLARLPFKNDAFDLAMAAWSIETMVDPYRGVAELVRVTRPGGLVCAAFLANNRLADFVDRLIVAAIVRRGAGMPLEPDAVASRLAGAGAEEIRILKCHGPAVVVTARIGEKP